MAFNIPLTYNGGKYSTLTIEVPPIPVRAMWVHKCRLVQGCEILIRNPSQFELEKNKHGIDAGFEFACADCIRQLFVVGYKWYASEAMLYGEALKDGPILHAKPCPYRYFASLPSISVVLA